MEDQVPFKVFAFWGDDSKPEVRRFGIDKSVVTSFQYLNAKLQDVYPRLREKTYSINWKDEDGDDVTISSDEELMTALTALYGNLVRLNIYVKCESPKEEVCDIIFTSNLPENIPVLDPCSSSHYGVVCDGCDNPVVGFRYKCTSCDDYDLCSKCESSGLHPEHCMVRVPSPMMPRHLIKAAIKRSRHFLKTVAVGTADNHNKRHRRERSGDRRNHGDRHHNDQNRGDHHRRPRTSWLETFATYMNEFANLAGDVGIDADQPKPSDPKVQRDQQQPKTASQNAEASPKHAESSTSKPNLPQCPFAPGMENLPKLVEAYLNGTLFSQSQPHDTKTEQSKTTPENTEAAPKQAEPSTSIPNQPECPFMPGVENIQKLIEAYFNGTLLSQLQQQTQQTQPAAQPTASENTSNANDNDVEMAQPEPTPQEEDKVSVKSEASGSALIGKDASPEKFEGWTMINKDKDLNEGYDKPTAPAEPSAPIGFNLPEEFRQHVNISGGQNLYPPLHAAAAVLNPKEPGTPLKAQSAQPTPPKGSAQTAGNSQPKPKPQAAPQRQPHPKPHIEAAIKQMMAMGFTNEEGWLTQLLESADGNIAAVVDLLTPAKSK